jgi:hypothetical protein
MTKPSTGNTSTSTVHRTFASVVALLWKILTIAQTSATRTIRPHTPLNGRFIFVPNPCDLTAQAAYALSDCGVHLT